MAILNSNPEVLLRKRKDKDRKRLEKQEQAQQRELEKLKKQKIQSKKFIRAETLVSNHLSKQLESKRVKNITKFENQKSNNTISSTSTNIEDEKLIFVIRIPNHVKGVKIPNKASKVLRVLRLETVNNGMFMKLNETTKPLLKLIHPYVVYGTPSIQSIRQLFQKRGSIKDEEGKIIKLDNNELVENKFEEVGIICIEDLIQELCNLSENFLDITSWLIPFKLNLPVSGYGPQSKLAKLKLAQQSKRNVSLNGNISLKEVDIDKLIDEQN
ncbi:ribosomal-like protein [Yamadazyma tenuis]|uniref:Ribosomal protein L30p/L7e n=1 Tax=Candida tenuis (strain ATCC 10573 / BCRC 21748 / CBS 615 / JCM 9827 / NBRC 10315 / NRRL Y-1498 / VKM Y-70) TaxID=590646 RepID=G3AWN8_CANTC|nr:ribosomal protein L30p/L7e [Yamadazyma tenuis ATCC 10573]EGV66580.1 ribosomal protein L30p/L7e [Yamadazyma tenuis ATCC 10573]WEJ95296.1 ribosomal-like protein [Yamadazyma tenuis]